MNNLKKEEKERRSELNLMLLFLTGILITAKQRHEFRIRLQKRARRRMEKRIDMLEDERHTKSVRICFIHYLFLEMTVLSYTVYQVGWDIKAVLRAWIVDFALAQLVEYLPLWLY